MMPESKNKPSAKGSYLSIHVHVNGLSFFTHNHLGRVSSIYREQFAHPVRPDNLHNLLLEALKREKLVDSSFLEVRCSVENNLATIVPKKLFEEASLKEYLHKDIDLKENDFITHDHLPHADWVGVYVPYVNVNNMLLEQFGSFTYYHAASVWIGALNTHTKADGEAVWGLYKEGSNLHIALFRNKYLQYYSSFVASSPEDVAYYVLLTAKELNINPEEVPLYVAGSIAAEDEVYNELFPFVRSIHLLQPESKLKFDVPQLQLHQDFCLLNLY